MSGCISKTTTLSGSKLGIYLNEPNTNTAVWEVDVYQRVTIPGVGVTNFFIGRVTTNRANQNPIGRRLVAAVSLQYEATFFVQACTSDSVVLDQCSLELVPGNVPEDAYGVVLYDPLNPPLAEGPQGPPGPQGPQGPPGPSSSSSVLTSKIALVGPTANGFQPATATATSRTTGIEILPCGSPGDSKVIAGGRFYHAGGGGPRTMKVSLWNTAGILVTSGTVVADSDGIYEVEFTAPVAFDRRYTLGVFDTTGARYTSTANPTNAPPAYPFLYEPGVLVQAQRFQAGDAFPSTLETTMQYPIDPIIRDA